MVPASGLLPYQIHTMLARKIVFYQNPLKFINERDYPDNVKHLSESWFDTTLSVQCTVFSVFKVIYMREMW